MKFHKNYSDFNRPLANALDDFFPPGTEIVQSENDKSETLYFRGPAKNSLGLVRVVTRFAVALDDDVRSALANASEGDRATMQDVLVFSLGSQVRTLFNPNKIVSNVLDEDFNLVASMGYLDGVI